jgi:beta-galactosidase
MVIGVDYYPEHWDEKLWEQDAELMKQSGVKVVRLAEFAWSKLEPMEGIYNFEWLDQAVKVFEERNIDVILCTPTNCPPLWLYQNYPDAIQTGRDGKRIAIGIRGHRCYTSPTFRKFASIIIDKMTSHYAGHKSVIAWQIDNELEANYCCCEHCTADYREWMKKKYGSLMEINKEYGNNVWSGEYSDWNQIIPPMGNYPYAWYNPSYVLDYNRFASDSMVEFIQFQAERIRKNCPDTIITTNTWLCDRLPDFYDTFRDLDVVSYDNYPVTRLPSDPEQYYSHAFHLDLMRGIKNKNFWIMEQLSGALGSWAPMSPTPRPGMIKGYSLQAFAHGADMVVHFRWRTAVSGAEMFWHGLIDHNNIPGRRFAEFTELCNTVNSLQELEGSVINNHCAILYSSDQEYALKIQPQTEGFHYYHQLKAFHHAFMSLGVGTDIINQYEDFSSYKIVVVPTLYITDDTVVKRLYEYAKNGGIVIITNRSGVKDINNKCIMDALPTVYRELVGAYVVEYDAIGKDSASIKTVEGKEYEITQWCDILETDSAEILATYNNDFYAGKPAVTKNKYGDGTVYYIGTVGKKSFYRDLCEYAIEDSGMNYMKNIPEGVELTVRESSKQRYYFIFNNTDKKQLLTIMGVEDKLDPFEMHIYRESDKCRLL